MELLDIGQMTHISIGFDYPRQDLPYTTQTRPDDFPQTITRLDYSLLV